MTLQKKIDKYHEHQIWEANRRIVEILNKLKKPFKKMIECRNCKGTGKETHYDGHNGNAYEGNCDTCGGFGVI